MKKVVIDGSQGEGGGQIIRNAVCYAALLRKHILIHSVRAGRRKPGLRAQHLAGLHLAANICDGRIVGASVGSEEFEYIPSILVENACEDLSSTNGTGKLPKESNHREIIADIGTAGSICLLLQVGFPCMLMTMCDNKHVILDLRGGTNADLAPQIDYMELIFLPIISRQCFGYNMNVAKLDIKRRGYYPRGGGIVKFSINKPSLDSSSKTIGLPLRPFNLMKRGQVTSIFIKAFYADKVPQIVAKKLVDAALGSILSEKEDVSSPLSSELQEIVPLTEIIRHDPAIGSASGILLVATTSEGCIFGGSSLGRKGEDATVTGQKAARELLDSLRDGGCVDDWLQDQLIIFAALADGVSKILTGSLTLHTQSAIRVAEEMTKAKFEVRRVQDETENNIVGEKGELTNSYSYGMSGCIRGKHIITCQGIGYRRV